jgi:hypothetical protein
LIAQIKANAQDGTSLLAKNVGPVVGYLLNVLVVNTGFSKGASIARTYLRTADSTTELS